MRATLLVSTPAISTRAYHWRGGGGGEFYLSRSGIGRKPCLSAHRASDLNKWTAVKLITAGWGGGVWRPGPRTISNLVAPGGRGRVEPPLRGEPVRPEEPLENTKSCTNAGSMLGHRPRQWPSIHPALVQCLLTLSLIKYVLLTADDSCPPRDTTRRETRSPLDGHGLCPPPLALCLTPPPPPSCTALKSTATRVKY